MSTRTEIHYGQATETKPHHFVLEASDLGLPPGHWPCAIATEMGNKQPFYFTHDERNDEGELVAGHYKQILGCITLTIYND